MLAIPGLFLLNGPGFRALADWGLGFGLSKIQLDGEYEIAGTLLSGIEIRDLVTSPAAGVDAPASPVRALAVGFAEVRYSLVTLVKGAPLDALQIVRLRDADITVDLPPKKEKPNEEPEDARPKSDPLAIVWKLLGATYDLENVNFRLLKEGSETLLVEGLFLRLGEGVEGELGFARFKMGEKIEQGETSAPLRVAEDALVVGRFEPIEGIVLQELSLLKDGGDLLTAAVEAEGGTVSVRYGRDKSIAAELVDGPMDVGALAARFGVGHALKSGALRTLELRFVGDFKSPASWDAAASLGIADLTFPGEGIDSATLFATSKDGALEATLEAERKGATARAVVTSPIGTAPDIKALTDLPAALALTANAPAIAAFLPEGGPPITGGAALEADLTFAGREPAGGTASITTNGLAYDGLPVRSFVVDLSVPNTNVVAADLTVALDEVTAVTASGTIGLARFDYSAEAEADVVATPQLAELLARFKFEKPLEGNVDLVWSGQGVLKPGEGEERFNEGKVTVSAKAVRFNEGRVVESADVAARYAPGSIVVQTLDVASGDLAISAAASYENDVVGVTGLSVRQSGNQLATGEIRLPYDPAALKEKGVVGFFDQEGAVAIDFSSADLEIAELAAMAGKDIPVRGTVTADIAINGTPQRLSGGGTVRATGLKTGSAPDVPPGDLALQFTVGAERATVAGSFEHPQIETLAIDASVPFRPEAWAAGEPVTDEPLSAKLQLPASSLEFVKGYVDAIDALDGTAAIDVTVGGTVGKPEPTGLVAIGIADFRMKNPLVPKIRDAEIRISAAGREVVIEKFDALVSGGNISLGGGVSFPAEGGGPVFDIVATAREALVFRNPDTNVRTDADLTLTGPYATAALAGEIGITNGRFTKSIDILPIGLPGGSERSELPEIGERPTAKIPPNLDFGVPLEPFKNWSVDVKIVTRDPFLVRGNLARIDAVSDLRVGGTLGQPVPTGRVYVADGRLTLPFSKVEVQTGKVMFGELTGFNGELDVQAKATVRQYAITIYVYGRVLSPQHVLTSDPPLSNEDIISLLATGATREELTSGGGAVAASKAAQLFLKKLRQDNIDPDDEPGFLEELDERTTLDVGQTDPRTGTQTIAGRIRLFRQLYLAANVSPEGDYRGLLKYVFKLR